MKHLATALALLLVAAPLGLTPRVAHAGGTRSFELREHADFDAGEAEGTAIEATGKLSVGFVHERAPVDATSAFTCLARKDDALVGTADKARVLRVLPSGGKKGAPKVEALAELPGIVVTALAELPGGDIVAATLPGGTLSRIDSKGKVTPFAKLEVEAVWALLVHDGHLFVGTGPKGELFRLSLGGKDAKVVMDVEEKHVLALMSVGKELVAGTSGGAKLYQLSKEPTGLLLHSFTGDEVRALALTRTGLVAAVNSFEDRKISSLDALTKNLARTSLSGQAPSGDLGDAPKLKSDAELVHVDLGKGRDLARASEATWDTWLRRENQYFTSVLALDDVGTVLVATSEGGKVYRTRGPRDAATIADLEERQTTALCRPKSGAIVALTGQGAAAYRLSAAAGKKGRYRTKVLDAVQPARLGALVLRAKGPVRARVRVGPTDDPEDKRWSPWQDVTLARRDGELRGTVKGAGLRRYVQVELGLDSPDAEVRELVLFYAPQNLAPLLTGVDVTRPEFDDNAIDEPEPNVTIKWKVEPRDEDELVYDVRVRPEGSGSDEWVWLHDEDDPVTKRELKWDLTTVPDGVYEIGVSASDAPSNGTTAAQTDEIVSAPVVVDRARPTVGELKVSGRKVRAVARDTAGFVHDVAFSFDGGSFRLATPEDGLFDGPEEAVTLELPASLSGGKHRLVLRARDSFGNIGTHAQFITAPK